MTLPISIAQIPKNSAEETRVTLEEFKGLPLCDIRVFGQFSAAQTFMPTKKGVSVNVAMLPTLIAALREAEVKAREAGLIPPDEG